MTAAVAVLTAHTALAHGAVLAAAKVNDNEVTPGVLGFLVVAGMGVVLYFLLKSMNRQLKKIPPPPPEEEEMEGAATAARPPRGLAARPRSKPGRPDLSDRLGHSPPSKRG